MPPCGMPQWCGPKGFPNRDDAEAGRSACEVQPCRGRALFGEMQRDLKNFVSAGVSLLGASQTCNQKWAMAGEVVVRGECDAGCQWYHVASLYLHPCIRPTCVVMVELRPAEPPDGVVLLKVLRPRPWKALEDVTDGLASEDHGEPWVLSF